MFHCIQLWQAPQGHKETLPCLSDEQKHKPARFGSACTEFRVWSMPQMTARGLG